MNRLRGQVLVPYFAELECMLCERFLPAQWRGCPCARLPVELLKLLGLAWEAAPQRSPKSCRSDRLEV